MKTHIIDALRPEPPALDSDWEAETVRAILENRIGAAESTTDRKGRLVRVALIAAAVVAIIGGIVVARSSLPPDDVRPAKPVEEKVQTIDPSKATKLTFGDTLDVVAELPRTLGGDQLLFSAFVEDDVVVGAATPALDESAPGAASLKQAHPVMYDLDTKTFTVLDDRDRPAPTQVVDVSGDEKTVVWVETVGTNIGASDFTIYSYDRPTKQVTALGTFDDPEGQIAYGNDLAIADGTAYFSTLTLPTNRGQAAVYAVPVDGSNPPGVIAKGGMEVNISGDTLTYFVSNPKDVEERPKGFAYDLRTGKTTPVPVSAHADDPGFCGAEFSRSFETWCIGGAFDEVLTEPAILTIKERSGRTTELAPFPVGSSNPPIPHDVIPLGRWTAITVNTDDGQNREFLLDLETREVKVFPDNTSFDSLSPDRSTVLVSSFAGKGPGPQRIARIPTD